METRVRVGIDTASNHAYRYLWTPLAGPPGVVDTQVPMLVSRRFRCMVDVVTPKYYELQNQGVIINNPLWLEDIAYTATPSYIETFWQSNGIQGKELAPYLGALEIPHASPTLPDTQLFDHYFDEYENYEALASNRAYSKVELSEAMILASLGELPETLRWMKSVLQRIVNLTKVFRGNTKHLKEFKLFMKSIATYDTKRIKKILERSRKSTDSSVSDFANAWLEYRYAIRPLIFEYEQVLKALKKVIAKGTRQTARGKEVNLVDVSEEITKVVHPTPSITTTSNARRTVKATYSCRAGVLFEIEDDIEALLAVWGIDQPLESVYELIPFSFILDWVFSVGDTISAWSINPSLRPLSSWVTYNFVHTESREALSVTVDGGASGYIFQPSNLLTQGKTGLTYIRKRRKPFANRYILPRFDLKLDLAKIIDLGLIGRSLLSGKRPYQKGA